MKTKGAFVYIISHRDGVFALRMNNRQEIVPVSNIIQLTMLVQLVNGIFKRGEGVHTVGLRTVEAGQ